MKVLVTGAAGFIGAALIRDLMSTDCEIIGIDNLNSYYTPRLKTDRLKSLGVEVDEGRCVSRLSSRFTFIKGDITDATMLESLFAEEKFDIVVNLAAQAGVRYSIENPRAYIMSNVVGFLNILECCRHHPVRHLVYASSSSVYGDADKVPYRECDMTDSPVSLYAATKKSDELMAHAYSHLYGIPATGLRFFTVYGPWGRPDMAPYLFMDAVMNDRPIHVFNHGKMHRDFTYIDDVVQGVRLVMDKAPADGHAVYNVGRSKPVELMGFINVIERTSGRRAHLVMEDMQPGDVTTTYADTSRLEHDFGFRPAVSVEEGISQFYDWYSRYHGLI